MKEVLFYVEMKILLSEFAENFQKQYPTEYIWNVEFCYDTVIRSRDISEFMSDIEQALFTALDHTWKFQIKGKYLNCLSPKYNMNIIFASNADAHRLLSDLEPHLKSKAILAGKYKISNEMKEAIVKAVIERSARPNGELYFSALEDFISCVESVELKTYSGN